MAHWVVTSLSNTPVSKQWRGRWVMGTGIEGALAEGKGVLSRALRVSGQGPGGWEVVPIGAEGSELGFQRGQS